MGFNGMRYDIINANRCQPIRNTKMGTNVRGYEILRWELMADNTIYRDGK